MDLTINGAMGIAGQTVASLYATIPVKFVLLVVAVLFCFAGYKLLRGVSALCGVILGVALGTCITSLFGTSMPQIVNLILTILAMVVFGIVLGVLCYYFYQVGLFIECAYIGAAIMYVPALFVAEPASVLFWAILAVCGALFGVTGVLFLRPAAILATSLFGFAASAALMGLFDSQNWPVIAIGLGLTAAGCVVQLMTNRNADALPLGRWKKPGSPIAEETKPDNDAHLRVPVPEEDDVSDSTQVLDMSALLQEEPDEIDSISDAVAARMGMTAAELLRAEEDRGTEPLRQEDIEEIDRTVFSYDEPAGRSDEPELVDDSTMLLSLDDVQEGEFVREEPAPESDVPLEQQAKFAWLIEQPVEAVAQDDLDVPLWDADEMQDEEADAVSDEKQEQHEETPLAGRWDDIMAPETLVHLGAEESLADNAASENALSWEQLFSDPGESETREEAAENIDVAQALRESIAAVQELSEQAEPTGGRLKPEIEQTEPVIEEVEPEQPEPAVEEAEPEQSELVIEEVEPEKLELVIEEVEPAQLEAVKDGKPHTKPVFWPVLLIVIALVFAAIGIQYVELALALCFVCYVLRCYRAAAFACAVLCVRRIVDILLLIVQHGSWISMGLDILSAVIFLMLTFAAMRAYSRTRHVPENETEE